MQTSCCLTAHLFFSARTQKPGIDCAQLLQQSLIVAWIPLMPYHDVFLFPPAVEANQPKHQTSHGKAHGQVAQPAVRVVAPIVHEEEGSCFYNKVGGISYQVNEDISADRHRVVDQETCNQKNANEHARQDWTLENKQIPEQSAGRLFDTQ